MTLDQLSQYITWGLYLIIFAVVVVRAVRDPMRANFDIALLFGLPGMLILISLLTQVGIVSSGHVTSAISGSLLLGMGYMLVRLVHDFTNIPAWILRVSELALAALVVGAFTLSSTGLLILAEEINLLVLLLFVSLAFIVASRRAGGVTGRRMAAIAVGTSVYLCCF